MKCTVCPFLAGNKAFRIFVLVLSTGVLIGCTRVGASLRPKTDGTLRVQMRERVASIDPRQWPHDSAQAAATEEVDALVFDRLVKLDEHGTPQPALAVSWQHDASANRWQFLMRKGVKFSDDEPVTPEAAALALQQLLGNTFEVSATSDSVVVKTDLTIPDMPLLLATGRYFIFHTSVPGRISGTGPFQVIDWPSSAPSTVAFFKNGSCWAGRPFVDRIELTMGADPLQQSNAIAFGQADVVELPASQLRRVAQRGVRIVSSDPVELLALQIDATRTAVQDARVRQAISLAVDRASIADVILQRQGIVAGSLLPNWISGYTHLFPVSFDVARAKELLAASGHEPSRSSPLALVYDSSDAEARAVADRVAVNLREVGIMVQLSGQTVGAKNPAADMRLVRHRLATPDSGLALTELLNSLGEAATDMETPEQIYAAERAPIDAFRVIPLVHLSESYGLSPQVRDWMPPRWGGWSLEDVWLDQRPAVQEAPQ